MTSPIIKPQTTLTPFKFGQVAAIQQISDATAQFATAEGATVNAALSNVSALGDAPAGSILAPMTRDAADKQNAGVFQAGADALLGRGGEAFEVLRYPNTDLGTADYPHYVMFFITDRRSSLSDAEVPAGNNLQFDYSQKNLWVDEKATRELGTFGGGLAGGALGKSLGKLGGELTAVGGTFGGFWGGLLGAGVGAGVGAAVFNNEQERARVLLKKAIALYLPHNPVASYNADWASEDLGIIGGIAKNAKNMKDAFSNIMSGKGNIAKSAIMSQANKIDTKGLGSVGGALQSGLAQVPNPFKAQLFKVMGFRQFAFEYSFLPRNKDEYDEVAQIIYTFKRYMHPVLGEDKFIMSYPAEFTLGFYHKDKPNENLFKVSNCALTSLNTNFGGTDFTTFRSSPGAPTEITMRLNFLELEMLTRDRIEAGY